MSTEAPIERLEPGIGYGPLGLTDAMRSELEKPLDPARIKKKPGKNLDYLAEHDVLRTANRIFGFGRWGTQVVELAQLNEIPQFKKDGKTGYYVSYRCTVRLTVAGCVPVDGVGYGDGVEYQPQAACTAHELAVKEAESDAIKRAFKKFGDQFGLILYAKDDERRALQAEANREQQIAELKATDEEIEALKEIASKVGPEVREKTDQAIKDHRAKNETERGIGPIVTKEFVAKMVQAVAQQGNAKAVAAGEAARTESGLKVPDGVPVVTDGTPEADAAAVAEGFAA